MPDFLFIIQYFNSRYNQGHLNFSLILLWATIIILIDPKFADLMVKDIAQYFA